MTHNRGWLVQFHVEEAAEAIADFVDDGIDLTYPAVSRHLEHVSVGDVVVFWVAGTGKRAGVYGYGTVAGPVQEREHPVSYGDPHGPRTKRPSVPVTITSMFDHVVIRRTDIKGLPAFADFELFRMPNRPNLFEVTAAQMALMVDLTEAAPATA
ncbi:EVE domain-containing protein [Pedococcus soli]